MEILITIPLYPEEVQITKSGRRAKYFIKEDKVPQKYTSDPERYIWKTKDGKETLFDRTIKKWVVKNAVSASRPRFQSIAGNEFYPGLHEHIRMKIVEHLKSEFRKNFPESLGLKYPIRITTCEVYTLPRRLNWDLDNLWIYTKCFQDALKEHGLTYTPPANENERPVCLNPGEGLIVDDNICFITESPSNRFVPVTREADRKLVYHLEEDTDPRVIDHLMYNQVITPISATKEIKGYLMVPTTSCKTGDISIDVDKETFAINLGTGKSERYREECFRKVFYQCVQMNVRDITTYAEMRSPALKNELADRGVRIWIIE